MAAVYSIVVCDPPHPEEAAPSLSVPPGKRPRREFGQRNGAVSVASSVASNALLQSPKDKFEATLVGVVASCVRAGDALGVAIAVCDLTKLCHLDAALRSLVAGRQTPARVPHGMIVVASMRSSQSQTYWASERTARPQSVEIEGVGTVEGGFRQKATKTRSELGVIRVRSPCSM